MKYSHNGLIYSYVLLLLHLSCWYYLTVRLPKWNFLFFKFEETWGGFHENLDFLRRLEEIWGEISNLRRFEEIWGGWQPCFTHETSDWNKYLSHNFFHCVRIKQRSFILTNLEKFDNKLSYIRLALLQRKRKRK